MTDKEKEMRKAIDAMMKRTDAQNDVETMAIAHDYVSIERTVADLAQLMSERIISGQMPMSALVYATAKFSAAFLNALATLGQNEQELEEEFIATLHICKEKYKKDATKGMA